MSPEPAISKNTQSDEMFRLVVEAAPNGMLMVNRDGLMTLVNTQTEQMFGYPRAGLLGRPIEMLIPEQFRPAHPAQRDAFFAAPCVRPMGAKRNLIGLRKDGTEFPVEISLHPIETSNGLHVLCSVMDVTERRRAEARSQTILQTALDGFLAVDTQGRIREVNDAYCLMSGYSRDELLARTIPDLEAQETPEDVQAHIAKVVASGWDQFESRHRRKTGEVFAVSLSVRYLPEDGGRFYAFIHDITERKRADAALAAAAQNLERKNRELAQEHDKAMEATRLKSEFLARMSHEIRTPMNGVLGMLQLAQQTELTAEQQEYLDTARISADALLTIINDILDFSKIEAGKLALETMDFDLRTTVEDVVRLLDARAHDKGVEVVSLIHAGAPAALRGDPGRLRQILTNLVGNAVKFTERGGVVVTVEVAGKTPPPSPSPGVPVARGTSCSSNCNGSPATGHGGGELLGSPSSVGNETPHDSSPSVGEEAPQCSSPLRGEDKGGGDSVVLRFSITDTGIGIPPEGRARLFQSFSQVDGSTTRKYGGTGLGLAISKQLVELMGGEIGVESEPGKGSTFRFTARLGLQPDDVGARHAVPLPEPHAGLCGLRVLVVDETKPSRTMMHEQLAAWKMQSDGVDDAPSALERLRAAAARDEPYELAIFDWMLPGMDGLELARRIKGDPAIAATRLVLLTRLGQRGHAEAARHAGIAAYLTKPVRQSQLYDCLAMVMGDASDVGARHAVPLPEQPSHVGAQFIAPDEDVTTGAGVMNHAPTNRPAPGARHAVPLPEAQSPPPLITRHTLAEAADRSRQRVLLAEDNSVNQKVAVRMLEKLGYRADVAADGQEAVAALARLPYDLVLMDCQMPVMDGYEATAAIRETECRGDAVHRPEERASHRLTPTKHIPIIAMTANAMQGEREKCLAAGMDDYLSKPVLIEDLDATLKRWLAPIPEISPVGAQFIAPDEDVPTGAGVMNHAPTNRPAPEPPALDPAALAALRELCGEDDPQFLDRLLKGFLHEAREGLAVLGGALARQDAAAVARVAHSLKGSAGNVGALRLSGLCESLEARGRAGALQDAAPLLAEATGEFARVHDEATRLIQLSSASCR